MLSRILSGFNLVGFVTTLLKFGLRWRIGSSFSSLVSPAIIQYNPFVYLVLKKLYVSAMWSRVAVFFFEFGFE